MYLQLAITISAQKALRWQLHVITTKRLQNAAYGHQGLDSCQATIGLRCFYNASLMWKVCICMGFFGPTLW